MIMRFHFGFSLSPKHILAIIGGIAAFVGALFAGGVFN